MSSKKAFLLSIGALTALCVLSFFLPIRGPWLDSLTSRILTERLSFPVDCHGVVIRRWRALSVSSCRISTASLAKEPLVLENLSIRLSLKNTYKALHITRSRFKDCSVKGGVALSDGGILRVHGVVLKNHHKPFRILCYTKLRNHGAANSGNSAGTVSTIL